jgi:hypothetical protein
MMRRILVDSAQGAGLGQAERGNSRLQRLDQIPDLSGRGSEMIAVNDALNTLAQMDLRAKPG